MTKTRRVLVAVDLEAGTDCALLAAIEAARASGPGTSLDVLHVFELFVDAEFDRLLGLEPPKKIEILKKRVEDVLKTVRASNPGAPLPSAEIHVTVGRPATEIVWFAAFLDVDLVVVGSHGRKGFDRLLLGSVAEKVVRLAGCEVLVARPKHHDPRTKVFEIEPLCDDCAKVRARTQGAKLWCLQHAQLHVRADHVAADGGPDSAA